MKEKYIKFFKKELVFLTILLVVICFSFGVSYSNFIYKSSPKRAVEMFTSKLSYELKINGVITNEINIYPGTALIDVEVKSLNPVKSYFKMGYKSENVLVFIYGDSFDLIEENGTIKYKLLVVNNNDFNRSVTFDVSGGFTNNRLDDVKMTDGYIEINNTFKEGAHIEFGNNMYRLLDINSDGSINIISSNLDITTSLSGDSGYNDAITEMNSIVKEIHDLERVISARSVNLEDIIKYSTNNPIKYGDQSTYCKNNGFLTYPKLFEYEKNSVIDYVDKNGNVNPSDEYAVSGPSYGSANCISSKVININNIEFKNSLYEDIFSEQESFIATRYTNYSEIIEWGLMSIKSGNIELNKLYDSNNESYSRTNKVRAMVTLDNKIKIELEEELFKVE